MRKPLVFVADCNGTPVHAEVSLCSYGGAYGLQVSLCFSPGACNAESIFVRDAAITDPATFEAEAPKMVAAYLAKNGVAELHKRIADYAAALVELRAESKVAEAKEAKRAARAAAKRKSEGYTHQFSAWIHPARGDDYRIEAFVKGEPTAADIASLLKKSTVKTDYTVAAL